MQYIYINPVARESVKSIKESKSFAADVAKKALEIVHEYDSTAVLLPVPPYPDYIPVNGVVLKHSQICITCGNVPQLDVAVSRLKGLAEIETAHVDFSAPKDVHDEAIISIAHEALMVLRDENATLIDLFKANRLASLLVDVADRNETAEIIVKNTGLDGDVLMKIRRKVNNGVNTG